LFGLTLQQLSST